MMPAPVRLDTARDGRRRQAWGKPPQPSSATIAASALAGSAAVSYTHLGVEALRVNNPDGEPLRMTVSIGVALRRDAGDDLESLLVRADSALRCV